ncbi:PIR protein, putative [Plasmodium sp. gorilla clade G1]|nr:PIR protein, putative [Plasmodium sp. gorilla clade G1]
MKLHYSEILLFSLLLNILEHNNNKTYITPHTSTITSRVLSECDLYIPKYDNDESMKSVKGNFDRQMSQRFEEYHKHMNVKRRKCKEQCDKDIQKIILKDKMEKSLEEKIEKGCLKCGCGLGGVAAGVGIFGGLGTYGWKIAATAAAYETAKQAGIDAGVSAAIVEIKKLSFIRQCLGVEWSKFINGSNYSTVKGLVEAIKDAMFSTEKTCTIKNGNINRVCDAITTESDGWLSSAVKAGNNAAIAETTMVETTKLDEVIAASTHSYNAIGYSVTAILIIVLIMVIIYLILRYRRKKKMIKKAQYTKLLNK